MKVLVNIYNSGNLFGMKTPAYGVPMDDSLYLFYKDLGMMIEIAKPKPAAPAPAQTAAKVPEQVVAIARPAQPEAKAKRKYKVYYTILPSADDPRLSQEWLSKDAFTEEELLKMPRMNLYLILTKRGHVSKRGSHDKLAPNHKDNIRSLTDKILQTNKPVAGV